MAVLPSATLTIDQSSSAFAGGTGYLVVMACTALSADFVPRVISSAQGLIAQYGYNPGVDYAALHFQKTNKPIMFIGMPITAAGTIGSLDASAQTGTSIITVTAGANGVLEETDGSITVVTGGTIGTDQIVFDLSLDGGTSTQRVRLGTANSYIIPNVGLVLNFAAGTLIAADVFAFRSAAPMWGSTAITSARNALAGQQNLARSWLVVGDVPNSTFANYVVTEANAYASANARFVYARMQVTDRVPLAKKSRLAAAVESLTFASAGHTVTRTAGSWILDGFAVGDSVTFSGTVSNNSAGNVITTLSATVMTFGSGMVNETIDSALVSANKVLTFAAFTSASTATFATVDAQKRVDLALGRARVASPITGWLFRRGAAWAASLREYTHDVQIPCWRKQDGPLDGFSLTDANGNIVEFDERYDGGGLAGRFTCLRTYGNGPLGAFVALSLTRDSEGNLLSRTHNMAVANVACNVVQAETENAIGQVLILNSDGTGSDASLKLIEQRVNRSLQVNLLQQFQEGPRASKAVWTASRTDILNTTGATLNGTLALLLNGTLEHIATTVRVLSS